MILYHRLRAGRECGIWFVQCIDWLKNHGSDHILAHHCWSQYPQTVSAVQDLIEVSMAYQAAYQNELEQHYDADLHYVYAAGFQYVVSDAWSAMNVNFPTEHDKHAYYIFNIPDEDMALQFKLANW
jgi:hypothetical protein